MSAFTMNTSVMNTAAKTPLRLTRRGRLAFLGLPAIAGVLAVLIGLGSWVVTMPAFASEGGRGVQEVTVMPGESLWSLAHEYAPQEDPRVVVEEIVSINDLHQPQLEVGQTVEIPLYSSR